jgi:hypothetical protein
VEAGLSSDAAQTAAQQQVDAVTKGLDFQKQVWTQEQANQAPFLQAGQTSIGNLMTSLQNGTFGAGSLPAVPSFTGSFSAPTLEEARQSPGYEFTAQQGSKGILQGAAAAGGAISGGTLKALDSYNTGLADTTYNDVFNRALSTYNTALAGHTAQLQDWSAGMAGNQQEFSQMFAPAQLGEQATQGLNTTGQQVSTNVGNLMEQIGNAQAAGTVGSSNAWNSGISGAANGFTSFMNALASSGASQGAGPGTSSSSGGPSITNLFSLISGLMKPAGGTP